MRVGRALTLGVLVSVLACGPERERSDLLYIAGGVTLYTWGDGGSEVLTYAFVSRVLADGGLSPLFDAGVALNGVPLGPPDPEPPFDGGLGWTRPSLPGVIYGAEQTLSVLGANPPASVSFTCPQQVLFSEPAQGAQVDRTAPLTLSWTPGGSSAWQLTLVLGILQPLEDGTAVSSTRADFLAPGTLSYTLGFPPDFSEIPIEATGSFTLFVPGESSRADTGCSSAPRLDVLYAPGSAVPPGQ